MEKTVTAFSKRSLQRTLKAPASVSTTYRIEPLPPSPAILLQVVGASWASLKGEMIGSSKLPWTTGGNELDSYYLLLLIKSIIDS